MQSLRLMHLMLLGNLVKCGRVFLALEGGNYFEYKYVGAAADIDKGFLRAYAKELPASGLNSREGQHLELYGADYDPQAPIIKFSILIPVKWVLKMN